MSKLLKSLKLISLLLVSFVAQSQEDTLKKKSKASFLFSIEAGIPVVNKVSITIEHTPMFNFKEDEWINSKLNVSENLSVSFIKNHFMLSLSESFLQTDYIATNQYILAWSSKSGGQRYYHIDQHVIFKSFKTSIAIAYWFNINSKNKFSISLGTGTNINKYGIGLENIQISNYYSSTQDPNITDFKPLIENIRGRYSIEKRNLALKTSYFYNVYSHIYLSTSLFFKV